MTLNVFSDNVWTNYTRWLCGRFWIAVTCATLLRCAPSDEVSFNLGAGIPLEDEAFTSANAALADLDGDGDLDIVLAKGRHWPLTQVALSNDGHGQFLERSEISDHADRTYTAALGDLNGDGSVDLVVGNDRPDEKRVYFNDGSGQFTFAGTFGEPEWVTRNVTLADLDQNGSLDIVVANRGGPDNLTENYVCFNDSNGLFPRCAAVSHESATTIAVGDLTGDEIPDLLVPHRDGGQSYILVNDGTGDFSERHPIGPATAATRAIVLGDFDHDDLLDVVLGDEVGGGAWLYLNRTVSFAEPIHIGLVTDVVYSMAVADLNLDGNLDLVLGNSGSSDAVFLNDGSGKQFTTLRFGDSEGATYGIAIGDVTGNARPDIVVAKSDARNTLYLNRGETS